MKFKTGDRVKVVNDWALFTKHAGFLHGKTGAVDKYFHGSYWVHMDNGELVLGKTVAFEKEEL